MSPRRAGASSVFCAPFVCLVAIVAGLFTGCGAGPNDGETRDIRFETADGVALMGTIYAPAGAGAPGLILIHMMETDRSHWRPFAQALQRAGYLVLAYDIRGHGDSARTHARDGSAIVLTEATAHEALADVAAAKEALIAAGADPGNIGIAGASIGANLALLYAHADPRIQALVLLSPGETYRGLETYPVMEHYRERPLLIMAAQGDAYAASSSEGLDERAQGFCELRVYPGNAHGMDLLWMQPQAEGQILQWLGDVLPPVRD